MAGPAVVSQRGVDHPTWDIDRVRRDFPMTGRLVRGQPLSYLDNAATALKPQGVIDAIVDYYTNVSANVARGVHSPSQEATERFEAVRAKAAAFLNAGGPDEVVFTSGTTAGLNLIASAFGGLVLGPGDEVLVSELEHHSNLVPWQMVAARTGARIRAIPVTDRWQLDLEWLAKSLNGRVKIVCVTHASNVLGAVVPIAEICRLAHEVGAVVVVDGAQGAPHLKIDVRALGCDFYAFSAHKLYGPTGLGVLYGRGELLRRMPPWQGGGGMIAHVEASASTYAEPPARFEAGTPPIAEVYGLGAALEYLAGWDRPAAARYEEWLGDLAAHRLAEVPGVRLFRPAGPRVAVLTFVVDGVHPHDVGTALDSVGVAVRAGHHCAQPLMRRLAVPATVRVSFAPYNTVADVDRLVEGVVRAKAVFGG